MVCFYRFTWRIKSSKNYIKMGNKTNLVTNKMLNHVFSSFGHGLKPMMNNYFVTLDELLIEMSEKSKSENKKKLYVESIRSIRVHKLNVMVSYLKTIQHTFSLFIKKDVEFLKDLYSLQKKKSTRPFMTGYRPEEFLSILNMSPPNRILPRTCLKIPWRSIYTRLI